MSPWQKTVVFFTALLLLAGCSAPVSATRFPTTSQAPGSTPEPSATPAPTLTVVPSATPAAASTTEPALRTNGPYLAYFRKVDGQQQLVFMDADGAGRKTITSAPEISGDDTLSFENLRVDSLSPDRKWLAYYSGSAGKCLNFGPDTQNYDLALNLQDLTTGQSQVVAHLLPENYPNNFIQNAKDLINQGFVGPNTGYTTPEKLAGTIRDAFTCGIETFAWTSDSHKLAFAGAMNGPSSDVYLYDLETQKIQRMSSGPEEVQGIIWSPDNKRIVQDSAWWVGEGTIYSTYAIPLDGLGIMALSSSTGGTLSWYNNHAYVTNNSENVVGNSHLRLVDVETGQITSIWDGSFIKSVFDAEKGLLVLFALPGPNLNTSGGTYLINIRTGQKRSLDNAFLDTSLFGLGERRFLTRYENEAYFILEDGNFVKTDPELGNVSVAPNQQHWISIGKTLRIFDASDNLLFELPSPYSEEDFPHILWRPDSSGLFIGKDKTIYALDINSGKIDLVETNVIPYPDLAFRWVGQK